MSRDAYQELNFDQEKPRGLFGERELAATQTPLPCRADRMEFTLQLRNDRPLSIAVTEIGAGQGTPWIFLAKSEISWHGLGKGRVLVQMPQWMAREKGLI